jgi:hypothetical protein
MVTGRSLGEAMEKAWPVRLNWVISTAANPAFEREIVVLAV